MKKKPKSISRDEGLRLFNHSVLIRGYGPTAEEAQANAREQAEELDLKVYQFLGRMGPEQRAWPDDGYVFYATFVERAWLKEHPR